MNARKLRISGPVMIKEYIMNKIKANKAINFRVSYSGLTTQDSFEKTCNKIPFVNIYPLFIPTVVF